VTLELELTLNACAYSIFPGTQIFYRKRIFAFYIFFLYGMDYAESFRGFQLSDFVFLFENVYEELC
jgi:hypothetical protein